MGLTDMLGGLTGRRAPKTGNPLMDALLPMLLKGDAVGGLASMKPGLVDTASPGGSLPTGNLGQMMKGLDFGSMLGG